MLLHYLQNSGEPYNNFPLATMIVESDTYPQYKIFIDELNDMMKAIETLTIGRSNVTLALRNEIETKEGDTDGFNWAKSIGKCRYSLKLNASRSSNNVITADITYILKDFYDFDSRNEQVLDFTDVSFDIPDAVLDIADITLKDLNDMHLMGIARCYDVYGDILLDDIQWNVGYRIVE